MTDAYAEPPYLAAVIRDSTKLGQTIVFRLSGGNQPPVLRRTVFLATTDADVLIRSELVSEEGHVFDGPTEMRFTWQQLEEHAHFPAQKTQRREDTVTVVGGTFDCWVYTVQGDGETANTVSEYFFAKANPGPPVLMTVTENGQLSTRMELISWVSGGSI